MAPQGNNGYDMVNDMASGSPNKRDFLSQLEGMLSMAPGNQMGARPPNPILSDLMRERTPPYTNLPIAGPMPSRQSGQELSRQDLGAARPLKRKVRDNSMWGGYEPPAEELDEELMMQLLAQYGKSSPDIGTLNQGGVGPLPGNIQRMLNAPAGYQDLLNDMAQSPASRAPMGPATPMRRPPPPMHLPAFSRPDQIPYDTRR